MRALLALVAVLALPAGPQAAAHPPGTSIGRAVEALTRVPVTYDTGALVTDLETARFPQVGVPWSWIGGALVVAALVALVALDRAVRRRP